MRKLIGLAVVMSCLSLPAFAGNSYWQGVCDGIRATEKYPATKTLAIIGVRKNSAKRDYFACNGELDDDVLADVTVYIHK